MMKTGEMPILIAHGGGHLEFPDNTLEAFYNAYDASENVMMETDVSLTKDGVLILSHDIRIDRRSNRTGLIADWNYTDLIAEKVDFSYVNDIGENEEFTGEAAERKKFKNDDGVEIKPTDVPGYPDGLPNRDKEVFLATTLEELILAFPTTKVSVEIKQSGETGKLALDAVIDLLKEHEAFDRVIVASFHSEIFAEFKTLQKQYKNLMYSPQTGGVVKYFLLKTTALDCFYREKVCVFQIPMEQVGVNLATKALVRNAHKHNIAVHYWTVDDEDDMRYLISIGADGIMTNYPHKLKAVFESYAA